jgi:xylan 1,4-beta-xylosidase
MVFVVFMGKFVSQTINIRAMTIIKNKNTLSLILLLSIFTVFFTCSKSDTVEEIIEIEEEIIEEEIITVPDIVVPSDPNKVVTVNTGAVVGQMYNFWSTRPMINQTRFNSAGFRTEVIKFKDYVVSYNLVRVLGGRTDNLNDFYKGVDASGNIITDFSLLLRDMRGFRLTGFKPRIVLDNVPWDMSLPRVVDTYGNSKPPTDYNLWRQYINAFLQTLVTEFGMNEVKTWRFRVGTEPNYSPDHWRGSKEDYFKHYDITVDEVLKVIPDAIIGPGNMLTEGVAAFKTELIDHCANGINYATGATGTRMSFFALSYYEKIDQNTIRFEEEIAPYRNSLNSYPQFNNIPLDIQEFGILRDENRNRGISLNDATEFGASWYAAIADIAYKNRVTEIYEWGQEIDGSDLPQGKRNVSKMFQMMEGGSRLETTHNLNGFAGMIPVVKGDVIYLLVYNHNTSRTSTAKRTIYPKIIGGLVTAGTKWKVNEWTVDKNNSIMMHEFYKDLRAGGVSEIANGRIYGNRASDRFNTGWETVLNANMAKYENLAKLSKTITDNVVQKHEGSITLKVDLEPHSVKLIELIPQ